MALLVALSPLLFYLIAQKLFSSNAAATIAALIYSLSGTIWFGSVFNAGLYANFFGILASLFSSHSVDRGWSEPKRLEERGLSCAWLQSWRTSLIIPRLQSCLRILILPLIEYFAAKAFSKRLVIASLLVVVPAGITVLAYPTIINSLELASAGGGNVIGGTLDFESLDGLSDTKLHGC